jgi:integrase
MGLTLPAKAERTFRKSGYSSKKEALEAEAEAARRIEVLREHGLKQEGPVSQALPKTLAALLEEFFTEHGTKNLAPKTLERYREQASYLDAALLALPYHEIRPLHLSREWNRLLAGGGHHRKTKAARPLSAKSVRNIASMISSAYERAIEWQIAEINPVRASKPPKVRKKPKPVLLPSQQAVLFDAANSTWGLAAFLELDAATGARRGELLALRWSDFDGKTFLLHDLFPKLRVVLQGVQGGK